MTTTNKPKQSKLCKSMLLPGPPPSLQRHYTVVEDVQEGEVAELLLQDKEDWVSKVKELRDVEEPGHIESTQRLGIVGIVDGLTRPAVVAADIEPPALDKTPQAEHRLEQVVDKNGPF